MCGPRSRQKRSKMSEFCLPKPPKSACEDLEVDKNRDKCLNFVYAASKISSRAPQSRQKLSKMSEFCLLLPPNSARAPFEVDKKRAKCLNFVYRRLQSWPAPPRSRQKRSKMPEFCLPPPPPSTQSVGILASPRIPPIQIIKDKVLGSPRIFFQ